MGRQALIVLVLIVLLLGAVGYIGYLQYASYKQSQQVTAYATFQQGAQYGMQQAETDIASRVMQQAVSCQPVPVSYNNQTVYMITIGCPGTEQIASRLQQQGQQNQQQIQQP